MRRLTGIDLAQYKRPQMERRIRSFADRKGITALPAYLTALTADRVALDEFLDRMTINVSQLWRNPEQWTRLQQTILPELARTGSIRAWSAGCSYGAEAYTLAAICREVAPGCRVEIRGTDIDPRMVARARDGPLHRRRRPQRPEARPAALVRPRRRRLAGQARAADDDASSPPATFCATPPRRPGST